MALIELKETRHSDIRLLEQRRLRSVDNPAWTTPRVLVLEPEETLAGLLEAALSFAGFTIEIAADCGMALAAFDRRRPTLIVLDAGTPGSQSMTLLQTLRARSDVPVILLTAPNAADDRVAGLDGGADDCLTKPFRFDELTARMRSVLRRHQVTLTSKLIFGSLELDWGAREVTDSGRLLDLTPREFDLLEYFMRNPRQVLTREAILNRVWGYEAELGARVVDVYIRYLRAKLGDVRMQRITTVRGLGYALRG